MKGKGLPIFYRRFVILSLFFLFGLKSYAQTDTEFWFVVPDITYEHNTPGGEPCFFTFSTFDLASRVTISMPGNPAFTDIVVDIPARTAQKVDMSKYVNIFNAGKSTVNIENNYNTLTPNKCGIRITATTPITAYYQDANVNNTEIYALKGKNALGQKFYTPFQTYRYNVEFSTTHPAYSSINIVATEDATKVTIKPTKDAYIHGTTVAAGGTYSITLNKGECIAVVPKLSGGKPLRNGSDHLAGTLVTSDKDIAITLNDDSVYSGGSYDIVGDQMVNQESLGLKYVVLRTQASSTDDRAYVTATEDGTVVTFSNNNGTAVSSVTLDAGQQAEISVAGSYCFVDATKKVSLFHVGGYGGELGGAVLPAIDKCTGSTQVAFYKLSSSGGKTFNTNIMVRTAGKNEFYLNGTKVDFSAVTGKPWVRIGTTDWWLMQILDWNTTKMPSLKDNNGNVLINKGDLFHFGVFYGASSGGCNYGYFSDFNELKITGNVAGVEAGETKVCFGTPIQMYATGGTTYKWMPEEYLNDATIFNPIANIPVQGVKQYKVIVSGACNMVDTVDINLQILPPVKASFSVDNITGCSPLTVNFANNSLNASELRWKFGDGSADTTSSQFSPPGLVNNFSHVYVNNSDTARTFTVQLVVKSEAGCGDFIEKKITVYPSVTADITRVDPTPQYCSPRTVQFKNTSPPTALPASALTYIWDYGDGTSATTSNTDVTHDFSVLDQDKKRFNVSLTMINKFGCKSVDTDTIDVYGKVNASFTLDKVIGCPNPDFRATLTDGSTGMIKTRNWTWDGFANTTTSDPKVYNISASNRTTNQASIDLRTIKLEVVGNGGCKDEHQVDVTINPYVNAGFTIGSTSLCDGDVANIINTSSTGSTDYFWDFGDGSTSSDKNPVHTFANSNDTTAKYTVTLTARSAEGCVSTYSLPTQVSVYSRIDPTFVIKDFGGCAPFNATIVNTSKGNAYNTFEWDFGDGSATLVEHGFKANRTHSFVNNTTALKDYPVELKVTNEGGCFKTTSHFARVYPQPVADFTLDKNIGCNPLPVAFTASTNVAAYDYAWSFDDGATGSGAIISHTYNNFDLVNDVVYNPILSVSSIYGCAATATKPITVHPLLKAGFTIQQPSTCAPFDVTITPNSLGATSYAWDFGNGTTTKTTSTPFTHTYDNTTTAPITYTVSMVASNTAGACTATATPVTVTVDPRVVADGAFTIDDNCAGKVSFTNTSTGSTKYTWDFGDGQSYSTNVTTAFQHTYENRTAASVTYTATLTAENAKGCKSTKTFSITIVPKVESNFTFEVLDKCTPMKVRFTPTSLNGATYHWDYGHTIGGVAQVDDKTSSTPFDKILDSEDLVNPKTYNVTLTTTGTSGCAVTATKSITIYPRVIPNFTSADVDKCKGIVSFQNTSTGAASYEWSYGDGSSTYSTDKTDAIQHTYINRTAINATHTVTLTATNAIGCSNSVTKDITVVPLVESSFTLDELNGCTPMSVKLTNTSLNGNEYTWDYGHTIGGVAQVDVKTDKLPFNKTIDSESLNASQVYTIKLTTLDKNTMCSDVSTRDITVNPKVLPSFTLDKSVGCSDLTVNVTNTSTGGTLKYHWDFGDGESLETTSLADAVSHSYVNRTSASKIYNLVLTATNAKGCVATFSKTVTVHPKVEAAFTFVQPSKCTPFPIDITNASLNGNEFKWDFGHSVGGVNRDTITNTKAGFRTYIYNESATNQTYTIKLTVRDATTGCSDVVTKQVSATPVVKSAFALDVDKGCTPLRVSFTNSSTGSTSYNWDFGNGLTSSSASPDPMVFTNTDPVNKKQFTVALKAINSDGCSNTTTKVVEVNPLLVAGFNIDKTTGCTPFDVVVTPTSTGATSYTYDFGDGTIITRNNATAFNHTYDNATSTSKSFVISMVASNSNGACQANAPTATVVVDPHVVANGTATIDDKCNGVVSFTNTSTGSIKYTWDFGDGQSFSTTATTTFQHTYINRTSTNKIYTATLTAENEKGCKAVKTFTLTIVPRVESSFTYDVIDKCTPMKINLITSSLNGNEFRWDYGHTIGGIAQRETRASNDPFEKVIDNEDPANIKTYTISLTTIDNNTGCQGVATKDITVYPRVVPSFTATVVDKCKGTVTFQNATTGANTYTWIFGDQSSSYTTDKLENVTHTYLNRNAVNTLFSAKLQATNANGCMVEASRDVTIVPRVEASFTLEELDICTPTRIKLTNTSLNGQQFNWDYGHTIAGIAQKEVRPDKLPFERVIDSESPNAILTYPIKLTIVDNNTSCADDTTINFKVYPKVLPSFTLDKNAGCSDLLVTATNTSTGGTLAYSWEFGDGQSVKTATLAETVSHTYINRNAATQGMNLVLTATNERGCKVSTSRVVNVYPKVEAAFTFIQPTTCTPFPIDITNASLNGNEYHWDFGHTVNGANRDTTTTTKNGFRTIIYNGGATAQTYTITLTARDVATGCSDIVTKTINAKPEVHSLFNLSVDKGCNPLSVGFTNNSTGATSYTWSFGNNTTSSTASPAAMTYTNNDTVNVKTYSITLAAKNADGCVSTLTKKVDVFPKILAEMSLDRIEGCTPLALNVSNLYPSSSYKYEWTLGSNGQNTSQQIPVVNFINSTTDYSVQTEKIKLKVYYKGDATCFKEVERSVNVYPGTRSDFNMDVTEACNPLVVNFTNKSKSYNNSASYSWTFDNLGSSAMTNPKYTFTNLSNTESHSYVVKLKSTSVHGCKDSTTKTVVVRPVPKAQIAINTSTGCAPFNVDVQNLSVGVMPTYTFWLDDDRANAIVRNGTTNVQFNIDNLANKTKETVVWHKVVSDFGCKDSISQKVYTHPHVQSSFQYSPSDAGCSPLTVNFTNTSANSSYLTWDFADGVTASVDAPAHVFNNFQESDKVFTVKLTATSEFGCVNSTTKDFTVFAAPRAYFTIDPPLRVYPDASFVFTNKTSPMAPNWNYEWTFGDGNKYIGQTPPVYTYKTWGPEADDYKYWVTLKVSNGNCKDEMKQFLYIKPAVPISIFSSSVLQSCAPLETQFVHQAQYFSTIEWDFGDGTKSTESSPVHKYPNPGKYYVRLAVKGDGGTTYSYTTLDVFPNPIANFKLAPAEAMLPEARVNFYNTSIDGQTYVWDFGDGVGISTEKSPVYSYKNLGSYNIKLTTTSEHGCVDDTLVTAGVKVIGEGMIKFPNAFIPSRTGSNGGVYETPDYKNEVFHPVSAGIVTYRLLIYNRWGQRLFESDDVNVGWDGYYNGKLCEQGVYVYRATGRYTNGKTFDVRGDVTLLR